MEKSIQYTPVKIGVEVRGIDLSANVPENVIDTIRKDVRKYRLLIFKDQGVISGPRHVEISQWFGELESTFYKHPRSPHPDVFRVSNNPDEGCTNVGRTGWHIDGSFMSEPFDFALYHMVSVPKEGSTAFVGFKELLNSTPENQRRSWERLWMIGKGGDVIHPLVYKHAVTGEPAMCFHLGMIGAFVYDYHSRDQRVTDRHETSKILNQIHSEIAKNEERLVYKHHWCPGDFIISDNRAVGHEATPQTQLPPAHVGLRVLHRTTIRGTSRPTK